MLLTCYRTLYRFSNCRIFWVAIISKVIKTQFWNRIFLLHPRGYLYLGQSEQFVSVFHFLIRVFNNKFRNILTALIIANLTSKYSANIRSDLPDFEPFCQINDAMELEMAQFLWVVFLAKLFLRCVFYLF